MDCWLIGSSTHKEHTRVMSTVCLILSLCTAPADVVLCEANLNNMIMAHRQTPSLGFLSESGAVYGKNSAFYSSQNCLEIFQFLP